MTDLFQKEKPKSEHLKDFILERVSRNRWISTHEVVEWGVRNKFADRALRTAQELCQDKFFRRMTDEEKRHFFLRSKEGYWVANEFAVYERSES